MENTYNRIGSLFPHLVKSATAERQSQQPAVPAETYMRSFDELKDTIAYYAAQQTPVYLKVSRRIGHSLTCDTYFGTFDAEMTGHAFRFYDIDNTIHRVIPAEHLLMIKPITS